ncbi:TPA: ABC transporter substrate-binding protein, partial [Klebsiella pneumoniae]|nr:ABC transporter substrate-binding protein [Klebsiella pneumoniae]
GKSTTLSGIEVVDDHTVKITLKEPNATFLHVLALNFASVVPREEVEKWGADFGKHPVGSGAFELQEWKLGQELIFRKNPNYFKAGVPRLDHIKFEMGQDPS